MLRVNEIFDSIQGEGIHVGRLATFVRLQGCNLDCPWCDTANAKAIDGGRPMSEEQILGQIFHPLVIITGGEPLVQDIRKLLEMMQLKKWEVHIETNGVIMPGATHREIVAFWSVSPKQQAEAEAHNILRGLFQTGCQGQVKFVIDAMNGTKCDRALRWAYDFMMALGKNSMMPVVLQPCWIDPAITYMDRAKYVARYKEMSYFIKQHWPDWDVRLIPQIHKMLALDRHCHKTINRKEPGEQWKGA